MKIEKISPFRDLNGIFKPETLKKITKNYEMAREHVLKGLEYLYLIHPDLPNQIFEEAERNYFMTSHYDFSDEERTEPEYMPTSPKHYQRDNALECIDEMLILFGVEEVKSFCKLNAWKYRYRAADKGGAEDIAKSDWYIRKYKELMDQEE